MNPKPIVFVVEDEPLTCRTLTTLFSSAGLECKCFSNAPDFLGAFELNQPGCILLDIQLPGMSGLELQQVLVGRGCKQPVIFMTGHADVPLAVEAMKRGAIDFVQKPFSQQLLLDTVWRAINACMEKWEFENHTRQVKQHLNKLSPREHEVLTLVVSGKPTKQIASILGLSHKTVDNHRASILEKMGASGVADLVRLTLEAEPDICRNKVDGVDGEKTIDCKVTA